MSDEASELDERISNISAIELQEEDPDPGHGDAHEPDGDMEAVDGYSRPRLSASMGTTAPSAPVTSQTTAAGTPADELLQTQFRDIGGASFAGRLATPETVHGPDDRRQITATETYPWRVHSSLIITAADGSTWIGTGWFVNRRVLITAGHCVYIKNSGVPGRDGWVTRMRVIPGRNGTVMPFGETAATEFHSVKGWTERGDDEYDYGAIVLGEPVSAGIGALGIGRYPDEELVRVTGNISGYPGDRPAGTQWYAARRIDSVTPRKVRYDIDTAGGQSGAAVYRIKDTGRFAVAIHAYGGETTNSGTRINQPVFDNLRHWRDTNATA